MTGKVVLCLRCGRDATRAARALGKIGDMRAVEPLTAILEAGRGNVQEASRSALVQIGRASGGWRG